MVDLTGRAYTKLPTAFRYRKALSETCKCKPDPWAQSELVGGNPGAIDTPLVRASLAAQGGEAALANRHPLGRIGRPAEIAQAVLWLTSSDASFVTATDLEVDGGLGAFGAFAEPFEVR